MKLFEIVGNQTDSVIPNVSVEALEVMLSDITSQSDVIDRAITGYESVVNTNYNIDKLLSNGNLMAMNVSMEHVKYVYDQLGLDTTTVSYESMVTVADYEAANEGIVDTAKTIWAAIVKALGKLKKKIVKFFKKIYNYLFNGEKALDTKIEENLSEEEIIRNFVNNHKGGYDDLPITDDELYKVFVDTPPATHIALYYENTRPNAEYLAAILTDLVRSPYRTADIVSDLYDSKVYDNDCEVIIKHLESLGLVEQITALLKQIDGVVKLGNEKITVGNNIIERMLNTKRKSAMSVYSYLGQYITYIGRPGIDYKDAYSNLFKYTCTDKYTHPISFLSELSNTLYVTDDMLGSLVTIGNQASENIPFKQIPSNVLFATPSGNVIYNINDGYLSYDQTMIKSKGPTFDNVLEYIPIPKLSYVNKEIIPHNTISRAGISRQITTIVYNANETLSAIDNDPMKFITKNKLDITPAQLAVIVNKNMMFINDVSRKLNESLIKDMQGLMAYLNLATY